jgi:hypothetical protein
VPAVLVAVLIAAGAIAAITLGKSGSKTTARAQQANAQQRAFTALNTRLAGPFKAAMGQRTKFFIAEADFLGATRDANAKIGKYKNEEAKIEAEDKQIQNANSGLESACRAPESTIPCPNPTYPEPASAPSVQGDISILHHAVSQLSSLNAEVLAVTPQPELRIFYAQLQAAGTALSSDAQANANILGESVTEPSNGSRGYIEEKKVGTIHGESGLPSVKLLNQQAVSVIQLLRLELGQYDVPSGTDSNPADHSNVQ